MLRPAKTAGVNILNIGSMKAKEPLNAREQMNACFNLE
jgi:hypothetical protein